MGFYSFTCAKTGLPVQAGTACQDSKLSEVKVLWPNGDQLSGEYDGYGRVNGREFGQDLAGFSNTDPAQMPKLVLSSFYKGEKFSDLGPSLHDPAQGYFIAESFVSGMHRLQANQAGFDGHQYKLRYLELSELQVAASHASKEFVGLSWTEQTALLDEMRDLPPLESRSPGEDWGLEIARCEAAWNKVVSPRLPAAHGAQSGPVLDPLPSTSLLADVRIGDPLARMDRLRLLVDQIEKGCIDEVLRAWSENVPVRTPDFEAMIKGEGEPWLPEPWEKSPLVTLKKKLKPGG